MTSGMTSAPPAGRIRLPSAAECDLFLVSALLLFLELCCIRWFPAHVLFLTFFTNTVLLACFLGMSVGCLAAGHRRSYLPWTPVVLAVALAAPHLLYYLQDRWQVMVDVNHSPTSPQQVFFGTEFPRLDLARYVIPVELLAGFFFLLLALAFVGLGQELGRGLERLPNRIGAYSINLAGSLVGIVLFVACSWGQLDPLWWFLPVVLVLAFLLLRGPFTPRRLLEWTGIGVVLFLVLCLADFTSGTYARPRQADGRFVFPTSPYLVSFDRRGHASQRVTQCYWSPYYRIDYDPAPNRAVYVNLIIHQRMLSRESPYAAYGLPYALWRDAGGPPLNEVLIIGAGSGNDVSRALQWGAGHVDAVEIDPVIARLGQQDHPDHPYQDRRVSLYLTDGRNFLRTTGQQYDLIVYALVDSLVLHSGYSNLRLESYLFTQQALADVRRCLKPGGVFVLYNYFRQGWLVARLRNELQTSFGNPPLVLTIPDHQKVEPEEKWEGFTLFVSGETEQLQQAFARHGAYWLPGNRAPSPDLADGFTHPPPPEVKEQWQRYGLTRVIVPAEALAPATDDWPYLYLRRPMIPELSLRGMAVLLAVSLLVLFAFLPRRRGEPEDWAMQRRMFFLGAGFMLVETKAVVQMALLFGGTWMVNSVVFAAVVVMLLAANLLVLLFRPSRLGLAYAGLFAALALGALVPLDAFLGLGRWIQITGAGLLVFLPILFAGIIFAVSFDRSRAPDRAFGANIAGAVCGGLAEYCSMLLGYQLLILVAVVFYGLSAGLGPWSRNSQAKLPPAT
jgi:SAM-dependent methyltransferase